MGILLWVIFGGIAGWIASMIVKSQQGVALDIFTGIVGAVLGGWLMSLVGYGGVTGFNAYSFIVAIIGSIVLLAIVKAIRSTASSV
jgi:uncharacterized membrane protein YeaQ/YmgE (transglycosylase-associated protein family)